MTEKLRIILPGAFEDVWNNKDHSVMITASGVLFVQRQLRIATIRPGEVVADPPQEPQKETVAIYAPGAWRYVYTGKPDEVVIPNG